jgi:cytochrome d ubiquinol oxidase subunit II
MGLELIAAAVLMVALVVYLLTGGADFGAGFWEMVARGERGKRERELITRAIAPIWEANHVWLIVAIVLLSGAFPKVLAVLSTALHVPLLIMLVGISLRGAAFVFQHYGPSDPTFQRRWGLTFSASSAVTPFFLGITLGAAVSGSIRVSPSGEVRTDFIREWLAPFPAAVGLLTVATCVFLSAVYLAAEAREADLAEAFRLRALRAAVALGALAFAVLWLSQSGAPVIYRGLTAHPLSWPFHLLTGVLAVGTLVSLARRRLTLARALAALQVVAIMVGLGMAQYPYLVTPDLTIANSAAPTAALHALLTATAVGLLLLAPSFTYLYWVFKFRRSS